MKNIARIIAGITLIIFCGFFYFFIIFGIYIRTARAQEYNLYNQKKISKQEAVNFFPDSAINEKTMILAADSVELLGNVLIIKMGNDIHAVSVKDVKYKGRGKWIENKKESSSFEDFYNQKDAEKKAVIKEAKGAYNSAAFYYQSAGNTEKANEMFLLDAEEELSDPDPEKSKESKYSNAAFSFRAAGEFVRAEKLYLELAKDAREEKD